MKIIPDYLFHDYMVPFLGYLMLAAIFLIPTALILIGAWCMRGWRRFGAVALAVVTFAAAMGDTYQAWHGGNLAGLLTMLSAPVATVMLLLIVLIDWFARRVPPASPDAATEPAGNTHPKDAVAPSEA